MINQLVNFITYTFEIIEYRACPRLMLPATDAQR